MGGGTKLTPICHCAIRELVEQVQRLVVKVFLKFGACCPDAIVPGPRTRVEVGDLWLTQLEYDLFLGQREAVILGRVLWSLHGLEGCLELGGGVIEGMHELLENARFEGELGEEL